MRIRYKWISVILLAIILILASVLFLQNQAASSSIVPKEGLLSPRVYTGLLPEKSYLIVNFKPLKQELNQYIADNNLTVGIYVENFRNGAYMGINERKDFYPASLSKLPLAIGIMQKVEDGKLSLDTLVNVSKDVTGNNGFGKPYLLSSHQFSIRELLEKLLIESDNTAIYLLLPFLSIADAQGLLDYYGINIIVNDPVYQNGMSPKSLSIVFSSLYFSTVLEAKNSEYLLSLMKNTLFDIKTIAGIPSEVQVIHKFGVNYFQGNNNFHDCGIMYIEESRIFYCVMTEGMPEKEAVYHTGVMVSKIYEYIVETRAKLDELQGFHI